jgi:hypothetical protein
VGEKLFKSVDEGDDGDSSTDQKLNTGKNQSWEPYNKGMTHGFVLEFRCQEDLDYYLTEDPVHLAFSAAAKPLIEDSVVVGISSLSFFSSSQYPLSQPKQNHLSTPIVEYPNLTAILIDIHDGILFGPSPPKPAPKSKTYKGSCHCGDITWTAKLEKAEHVLCHCDTCKKLGGGPYSLNAIIEGVSVPVFLISLNIFW